MMKNVEPKVLETEYLQGFSDSISIMMKDDTEKAELARWGHWDLEEGYTADFDPEKNHLPHRSVSPGLHMGLTVLLDVQKDEYYCPGAESIGFKVRLSWIECWLETLNTYILF